MAEVVYFREKVHTWKKEAQLAAPKVICRICEQEFFAHLVEEHVNFCVKRVYKFQESTKLKDQIMGSSS